MSTSGVVTNQYPTPTPNSAPAFISLASDGALWFTESNPAANMIGRITTDGVITEFSHDVT
jgi:virginiamycin B lyase